MAKYGVMVGGYIPSELAEQFEEKKGIYHKTDLLRIFIRRYLAGEIKVTIEDVMEERRKSKEF